jgi:hypothetical protein
MRGALDGERPEIKAEALPMARAILDLTTTQPES